MTARTKPASKGTSQGIFLEYDLLKRMVEKVVQEVIDEQLSTYMKVDRYQRGEERKDYRNGYKPRTMKTRVGKLDLTIPQVRSGNWRPTVFERYQRSERALIGTLQEIALQGVSTRKVSNILQEMAGFSVSASTVSRTMLELDEEISRFRSRSLSDKSYPYLVIDARYERIRHMGQIVKKAFLIVAGINEDGYREILDFCVGNSESEETWGDMFASLKRRGLSGTEMIVSDAHLGIQKALARHFQGVAWQRCKVHFARELLNRVSLRDRAELARDLKSIFLCDKKQICLTIAEETAAKWEKRAPLVSKNLLSGIEDCLSYKSLPPLHQVRLSSTNMLERIMRECKRRSKVISIFPNDESCTRYLGSLLIEMHEEWLAEPYSSTYLPSCNRTKIMMSERI